MGSVKMAKNQGVEEKGSTRCRRPKRAGARS